MFNVLIEICNLIYFVLVYFIIVCFVGCLVGNILRKFIIGGIRWFFLGFRVFFNL